jgi:threonine aldolase
MLDRKKVSVMNALIDLRSDTVTRPTPGMRAAMAAADVGDDVFGEDKTVNKLEERVAQALGKEAALFVPSGTMSNQIAVRIHTRPGDEILCDLNCHIFQYEAGGPAALSGVMCRTFLGDDGILDVSQLEGQIHPDNVHLTPTRLVCLENTHNRGGGKIYPLDKIAAVSRWARDNKLGMHLDGARLWNAIVATGIAGTRWGEHFDTISVCFSKGLGAPVGSALVGPREMIERARRVRKLFGGGMRQAGVIAAGALYALEHHVERLRDDHANAQILANAIRSCAALKLAPEDVQTNLIWFRIDPAAGNAQDLTNRLRERGVLIHPLGSHALRACTHLDVTAAQIRVAADALMEVMKSLGKPSQKKLLVNDHG